jgi:hypothetical protein
MSMTLKLQELTFNRKTAGGRPAAIPIRAGQSARVEDADWRGSNDDVTYVAWPLSLTAGDIADLRVTATFAAATPPSGTIFIRAIGLHGRLLGDVVSLPFAPSDVGRKKQFSLTGVLLPQAGIDAHTVEWQWEWSADGQGNWQRFAESAHPVFVIVDQLKEPWGRGLNGGDPRTSEPWREVMAQACKWAKGLRDEDRVVEAITVAVDGLAGTPIGGEVVRYQNGGNLCYGKVFEINSLLDIVEKRPHATTQLNCQDINTTIAMFSTILGCDVRLISFHPNGAPKMHTNPVKMFGRTNATNEHFGYHEVAARCGQPVLPIHERPVWDACLKVDFDVNPAVGPPADFDLPKGLAIAQTRRDLGYRIRLLQTASQNCIIADAELDGLRYPLTVPDDIPTPISDPFYIARRLSFQNLMSGVPVSGPTPSDLFLRFEKWLATVTKEGYRRRLDIGDPKVTVLFTQLSPAVTGGSPMTVQVLIASGGEQAAEVFLTLAANYTGVLEPTNVGDFGLEDSGRTVLFLRGPVVAILSDANEQVDPTSNFSAAVRLDEHLKPVLEAPVLPV